MIAQNWLIIIALFFLAIFIFKQLFKLAFGFVIICLIVYFYHDYNKSRADTISQIMHNIAYVKYTKI